MQYILFDSLLFRLNAVCASVRVDVKKMSEVCHDKIKLVVLHSYHKLLK